MQNRDPQLETSGKKIAFYEREFFMFSNFSSFAVKWKNKLWQTSEHAYQAAKFMDKNPEIAEEIFQASSAHAAKKIAEKYENKVNQTSQEKIDIMIDICRHKLQQHPYIQKKLLQTENLPIIEDSPKDSFWGWGPAKDGRNELGKI